MLKRTPLYEFHRANGKLVEFAGYDMPVWYTSITEEHMAVRDHVGIFDVSHMGRVEVSGNDAGRFVESLFPSRIASQPAGKCVYTVMLNENAGIIDDLIVLKDDDDSYLLVVNASRRTMDVAHMKDQLGALDASLVDVTDSTTMVAVQGPNAIAALQPLTSLPLEGVKRFTHTRSKVNDIPAVITRTGYTGEDGFEVILYETGGENSPKALATWAQLAKVAKPCGLGARDSLRLEAGLPLYGSDLDETVNPLEADLAWVVSKDKKGYTGEPALSNAMRMPLKRLRRGIIMDEKIPRRDFKVTDSAQKEIGTVTSGSFSPVLKKGIALAYLNPAYGEGRDVKVLIRDAPVPGKVMKPPFYDESVYGWKRGRSSKSI